jgi:DNA-binding MarR family transcriptional regulator
VDELVDQWAAQRSDLALDAMATFGRLGRFMAFATRSAETVFAAFDLGIGEFDVLAALRRSGEPYERKPTQLARALMLSPAGMTSRLDRLENAGYLTRRNDPDDRRGWIVSLSPEGLDLVDRAVMAHVANEEHLLSALTTSQRRALDTALRRLLAQFE